MPKKLSAFERVRRRIPPITKLSVDIQFAIIDKLFEREHPKSKKKHNELHDFIGEIMEQINKDLKKYRIIKK